MTRKLSSEYSVVWPGIPVPHHRLLDDDQDSFSFWCGDVLVGVNRNVEYFWRNREKHDPKA